jgi:hypothetical protein
MTTDSERFERVLSRRLSGLANMPVDTGHLDRLLAGKIPAPPVRGGGWRLLLRRAGAVAASLAMVGMIVLAFQGTNVEASSEVMAQMHREIAKAGDVMQVDSIDAVNRALAAQGAASGAMVTEPETHRMVCCMKNVGDKKVACVLLNNGGTPVTVAVADCDTMEMSCCLKTVIHKGEVFHVESSGDLNMVMLDRAHHHVCVIGAMPVEHLMTLADGVTF